jgi:hypothetical protein
LAIAKDAESIDHLVSPEELSPLPWHGSSDARDAALTGWSAIRKGGGPSH